MRWRLPSGHRALPRCARRSRVASPPIRGTIPWRMVLECADVPRRYSVSVHPRASLASNARRADSSSPSPPNRHACGLLGRARQTCRTFCAHRPRCCAAHLSPVNARQQRGASHHLADAISAALPQLGDIRSSSFIPFAHVRGELTMLAAFYSRKDERFYARPCNKDLNGSNTSLRFANKPQRFQSR